MNTKFLPFLFIISLIAGCIEIDISVPSFPDISDYFKVSDGIIQLTIAFNFLGFCLASIIYGPLSEVFGRRKVMIIGNGIMLVGAIGCVISNSIILLLISRFIQGLGAATSAVITFAMIADVYKGERSIKLIGIMNSIFTILMTVAPIIGSLITEVLGWRGNYGIVAIITLFSWILLFIMLPETNSDFREFNFKQIYKDYKKLLFNTYFISSSFIPSLLYSAYLVFVSSASFLYMETFNLPILTYAFHQAIIVASLSIGNAFSNKVIQKIGNNNSIILGTIFYTFASILFIAISIIIPHSPYLITLSMIIFCIGFALCYPVIFTISLEIFPDIKGIASSANMSLRALLNASFIGLLGYLFSGEPIMVAIVILIIITLCIIFTKILLKQINFSN
ncbi:MAG: multidrug effflux MFS transporter [Sphingobacteriia bacterium]|nr:multidrug effflux MFS transporter [Sphingobacteriia bacterium]